ncbi:hypothetical protein JXQ70_04470 [bacterium]|nr:hypothetical protein [bacterium]
MSSKNNSVVPLFLILGLAFWIGMSFQDCSSDRDNDDHTSRWTFMIWMNGDNDLEYYVTHDLNELEQVGSGDGVHVIVQADRIDGYATDDGDWTGTRRYYITHDDDMHTVSSSVIQELGEVDMGDPDAVADFLTWVQTYYPAEKYVLIFWNHGDGWSAQPTFSGSSPLPFVSYDETSGSYLSIVQGDLRAALNDLVARRGPLEVIGFDACNMACWEVAHSLSDQIKVMAGSEAWVDGEGYMYAPVLARMRTQPDLTPAQLADELSRTSVEQGQELTHSAIDLAGLTELASAIDGLASCVLADPGLEPELIAVRNNSRGADEQWKNWYLDLRDFAHVLEMSELPLFSTCGRDLRTALDKTMISHYGNPPYDWTGGLSIFFDLEWLGYLELYHTGTGATWSQDTRWDDLLLVLAAHNATHS